MSGDVDLTVLPRVNNGALAVGFMSATDLAPLQTMLAQLFNKEINESKKGLTKVEKAINKTSDENNKNQELLQQKFDKFIDNSKKQNKELLDAMNDNKDSGGKLMAYGWKLLKSTSDFLQKEVKKAAEDMNIYRDLERSGVVLTDGFKSLSSSAKELGMTHADLAQRLAKMAPTIAKLNLSMGNGAKVYTKSVQGLTTQTGLMADDIQAVFESVVDAKTPMQLMAMSQNELRVEVENTAKQMKALSLATGKSIELIKQEQETKNRQLRIQAWKATHQAEFNTLTAMGRGSDEWIDYYASGGARITPEIVMKMAGSSFARATDAEIKAALENGTLNMESAAAISARYQNLARDDQAKSDAYSRNKGTYSAASASNLTQVYQHGIRQDESFINMANMQKEQTEKEKAVRAEDVERLRMFQQYNEDIGRMMENIYQTQGGIDKSTLILEMSGMTLNTINKGIDSVVDILGKYLPSLDSQWAKYTQIFLSIVGDTMMTAVLSGVTSLGALATFVPIVAGLAAVAYGAYKWWQAKEDEKERKKRYEEQYKKVSEKAGYTDADFTKERASELGLTDEEIASADKYWKGNYGAYYNWKKNHLEPLQQSNDNANVVQPNESSNQEIKTDVSSGTTIINNNYTTIDDKQLERIAVASERNAASSEQANMDRKLQSDKPKSNFGN